MANYNRTKVIGVGINDADYNTQPYVNGVQVKCHYYSRWLGLLERCYHPKALAKRPTYKDCTVCDEWLTFSNFKAWMEKQDWEGKQLDKDLLVDGNKVYSPDTCVFVDTRTNQFTKDAAAARGDFPIGVSFHYKKFKASINNPFNGRREYLGVFPSPQEAHAAWKRRKHELACQLADLQSDSRVANRLRTIYL